MSKWSLALIVAVAVFGGAAGCGGGGSGGSGDGSESGSAGGTDSASASQGVKWAECIRQNGVSDFPDPDSSGDVQYGVSVSPETFQAAVGACKDLEPPGALDSTRTPEEQSAALKFAECIRENGVKDFPDPVSGEPLVDTTKIPSTDTPEGMTILNAAMQTCGDLVKTDASGSDASGG